MKKLAVWMRTRKEEGTLIHDHVMNVGSKNVKALDNFVVDKKMLKIIQDFMFTGVHVAITGSPGTGKTELAKKTGQSPSHALHSHECRNHSLAWRLVRVYGIQRGTGNAVS